MTPCNQILPLASLKPGMILAEPIRDRYGNIMLTKGTGLTAAHLHTLEQRGIASALVAPARIPPSDDELAAMRQSTEERLRHIFRLSLDHSGNQKLLETILAYRLENLK